jgi:cytochrome c oxidase cbb3-type subunit III
MPRPVALPRLTRLGPALLSCIVLGACARESTAPAANAASPPPGVAYEAHLTAGALTPSGGMLRNPHAGDAAVAKNGAQLFTTMNCDGCHGGDAAGWVGPNLGDGRWRYGGSDAEVFSSIYYGRPKGMPAFGGALGAEGVWTLVTYLRSLTAPPDVPTESWEPD